MYLNVLEPSRGFKEIREMASGVRTEEISWFELRNPLKGFTLKTKLSFFNCKPNQ